jgi:hypothetical protein
MIAQIVIQTATLLLALSKDFFIKIFPNKKIYSIIVISCVVVIFAFGIILTFSNDKKANDNIEASQKQYDTLRLQYATLKLQYDNIKRSSEDNKLLTSSSYQNLKDQNLSLQKQLYELSAQISPFIKIATSKYPNLDANSALEKFRQELADVKEITNELAKPMMLEYVSDKLEKNGNEYTLSIKYKRNKNQPLGTVDFSVFGDTISNGKILSIETGGNIGAKMNGSESSSENGKWANISFTASAEVDPTFIIKIMGACWIKVVCNKVSKPKEFRIK